MKKFFTLKSTLGQLILILFLLTRIFIWINKPPDFSEITYSYMPYAHLWAQGTRPYLDQWYEYPPATIPLFYLPHLIDVYTKNVINYGYAYRGILLLIDIGLFAFIWKVLQKTKVKPAIAFTNLLFYILVTTKAHHFVYDTMDLIFAACLTLTVSLPLFFKSQIGRFLSWLSFFLASALKLINFPLGFIYVLFNKKGWFKTLLIIAATFFLIWGLPLIIFRSSLSVMLVYHQKRGLQIDSTGAVMARLIDSFTHTESVIEVYKNYEITGPYSDTIKKIFDLVFPASVAVFLIYSAKKILSTPKKFHSFLRLNLTLIYLFIFFLTAKVLSRPFVLWPIPLLAIYPFTKIKNQLKFFTATLIIIFITMTKIPNIYLASISLPTILLFFRLIIFTYLLINLLQTDIAVKN